MTHPEKSGLQKAGFSILSWTMNTAERQFMTTGTVFIA
jgi:hypothetical protein